MTVRTAEQASDALAADLIWRRKELTALRFLSSKARQPDEQRSLLRASVPLLYAHWEGYIKRSSAVYLEFVAWQRLRNNELSAHFLALSARAKLRAVQSSE